MSKVTDTVNYIYYYWYFRYAYNSQAIIAQTFEAQPFSIYRPNFDVEWAKRYIHFEPFDFQ